MVSSVALATPQSAASFTSTLASSTRNTNAAASPEGIVPRRTIPSLVQMTLRQTRTLAAPRRACKRWAGVPRAAQSQTISEDYAGGAEGQELPSPDESQVSEAAEEAPMDVVAALQAAVRSGSKDSFETVGKALKDLLEDRDSLAATLNKMETEAVQSKDRYLRLNADFDNFRKRAEREKQSLSASVKGDVLEALLPMVDSFERAKGSLKLETEAEKKIDGAYQGIYKQFVEVMRSFGVSAVETVGTEFDPQFHEAIMKEDSVEFADGVVSEEFRKGFVIGDKLIRPAMVKVSTGPGPASAASGSPEAENNQVNFEEAAEE